MELSSSTRRLLQRLGAVALAIVVVPLLVALPTLDEEAPVQEGEVSPRTITAEQTQRVVDREATEQQEFEAVEAVEQVIEQDVEAITAMLAATRDVFARAEEVRGADPGSPGPTTSTSEQVAQLAEEVELIDEAQARTLVTLDEESFDQLRQATISVVETFAQKAFTDEQREDVLDSDLPLELALRSFPAGTQETIARPLLREVIRPTRQLNRDATQRARDAAMEDVEEVVQVFEAGEPIVEEGEVVGPLQARALEDVGELGAPAAVSLLRAFVALLLVAAVVAVFVARTEPVIWASARKILLLSTLTVVLALITVGVSFVAEATSVGWWFVVPTGAIGTLAAVLLSPAVGLAMILPAVVVVLLVAPQLTSLAVFVAATVLVAVPLVARVGTRSQLRAATVQTAAATPILAALVALVFGPRDAVEILVVLAAGAVNGVVSAGIVQGLLPTLESIFQLPTVTALLDLADRNHPLLRELETKALGSYNHSVMVSSLTERACREIGANALLGSVAALYHDIGKVRQPHFFIENQRGIANPHDELEPQVSAVIIQNHVVDGVEMAREHRLPPEVVACIGSHHGTMLVTFFYRQAVEAAGGDRSQVDENHFRYKGTKPRSREAAVLVLADCSEATTRSMAMSEGTLPREAIESTVDNLLRQRIDDGQFDECELTFTELATVRDSIVEALVGVYHPRIAYPSTPA